MILKKCKTCKLTKEIEEFQKCAYYKDKVYRRGTCNKCINSNRLGKNKEYGREYRQRPEVKKRQLEYKRSEKARDSSRKRDKFRYYNDELFRLKKCMRSRINRALKSKRWNKTNKTEQYLGCTYEELKTYIEQRFEPGMTWENYALYWEIDHIIPLGKSDIEEDFYKLCHYTNLRPLLIAEHDIKSIKDTHVIKMKKSNKIQ